MTKDEAKQRRKVIHTRSDFAAKEWMRLVTTFPVNNYISGHRAKKIRQAQNIYEYYTDEWCKTSKVLDKIK